MERDAIEPKYLDHLLHYAQPHGDSLDRQASVLRCRQEIDDVKHLVHRLDRMMTPAAQEQAFGVPGVPGDATRIAHLAMRWNSVYEDLIDWAAEVRGLRVPDDISDVTDSLAQMVDKSIDDYRKFVDELVQIMDDVPERLAAGEHVEFTITLKLDIPPEATEAFFDALARAAAR